MYEGGLTIKQYEFSFTGPAQYHRRCCHHCFCQGSGIALWALWAWDAFQLGIWPGCIFVFLLTFTVSLSLVLYRTWRRHPQYHSLFVLLFTIRWYFSGRWAFFAVISYQGSIIIIINENLLFSNQPIKWQNLPVPFRVTSWHRGPSRAGSQVALKTRLSVF